jgi:hypothetical protein
MRPVAALPIVVTNDGSVQRGLPHSANLSEIPSREALKSDIRKNRKPSLELPTSPKPT